MIKVENLTVRTNKINRIEGFNATFFSKKTYVLLGKNGSGKSTLIKAIAGLVKPKKGKIHFKELDRYQQIGYVLDKAIGIKELNLEDNIALQCNFRGITKQEIPDYVKQLIVDFALENNKITGFYSAGMQKKLDIILSLLHDPKCIIWDEPFENLDSDSREVLLKLIQQLQGTKTFIIADHSSFTNPLATTIVPMK